MKRETSRSRLAAGTPGLIESAAVILPDEDGADAIAMFFVAAPDAAALHAALTQWEQIRPAA